MRRLNTGQLLLLNAYWVGLSFMWNSLHVLILPAVLLNFVPEEEKNSYLGLLTFAGLILAMIVQPIAGALSDRWVSRWGRRRPLIVIGTAIDFVFLFLLGWAGGFWLIFIGYIGLQLSSNLAHGAAQGLLPDKVPPEQMGSASGLKTLLDMGGLVVSSLVVGRLLGPEGQQSALVMLLVALVLAATAAITTAGTREESSAGQRGVSRSPAETFRGVFRVDLRANTGYWWLIASRFVFLLGIYGIQAFAQYYIRDRFARADVPNPVQTTADLMAAIVVALMAFALFAGWLSDRWGRRRLLLLAGVIAAVGSLLLLLARSPLELSLYGAVLGAGLGIFLSANWALATDLAPAGEAGKFLGLTNLATAGAGAMSRLAGPMLDLLNNARREAWWGYTALFSFGAFCALLSLLLLIRVPERRPEAALRSDL